MTNTIEVVQALVDAHYLLTGSVDGDLSAADHERIEKAVTDGETLLAQLTEGSAALTDEQIEAIAARECGAGRLSGIGFKKDADGRYTIPIISSSEMELVRACLSQLQSQESTAPTAEALENCRLFAARHRKEEWAKTILRLCAEGGATGSPLRSQESTAPSCVACEGKPSGANNPCAVCSQESTAPSDEWIDAVADSMPYRPWGIGSRRQDMQAFARALLAASPSQDTAGSAASNPEAMRRGLGDIISQTIVTERMGYADPQKWEENSQRIRQIARAALSASPPAPREGSDGAGGQTP